MREAMVTIEGGGRWDQSVWLAASLNDATVNDEREWVESLLAGGRLCSTLRTKLVYRLALQTAGSFCCQRHHLLKTCYRAPSPAALERPKTIEVCLNLMQISCGSMAVSRP